MKKYIIAAFILALSQGAWCQTKLIEKIDRKAGELTIPYSKYVLSNGLTVVIHEDHSDPIVHIDVTYHVGSAREIIGKSGFAHFFEHMMFQGSKHVGDDQHFKMVSEAGGTLNGTTNRDRTNYFETLPKNQLEVGLWLEADRMGFLLDSVTQQKFEIQRSTVKNERGQNYDNRPYGLVGETTSRVLYPKGHPYSWLTIGYISHLDAVDVNDLKAFFMEYYGAANATLTVGGDVNTADVLKLAEKYFGSIPAGPKVEKLKMPKVTLNDTRYISGADNIRFPLIQRTYPTVPFYSKDEPALDILASILADSKSSVFYKNFIKTQLGNSAQS
ncbi:MAG TPA: pitrilysin family protein, partial [Bacteroidia bacterium]|nr:pitrilysin family protein [Bacteroidia bacterium]